MIDLELYEETTIFVNQAERPATVLAIIGDDCLLEYEMPKGTTALRLLNRVTGRHHNMSYAAVPTQWLEAIVDAGGFWLGCPQQNGGRVLPKPAEILARRRKETV